MEIEKQIKKFIRERERERERSIEKVKWLCFERRGKGGKNVIFWEVGEAKRSDVVENQGRLMNEEELNEKL